MCQVIQRIDKNFMKHCLSELLRIEAESFGELQWTQKNLELDLPGKWTHSFGLRDHRARFVGYLIAGSLKADHVHIYRVAVLHECRGRHYGSELLKHSLDYYLAAGIREVTVEIDDRFPVDEFYLKNGFERLENENLAAYIELRGRPEQLGEYVEGKARVYRFLGWPIGK